MFAPMLSPEVTLFNPLSVGTERDPSVIDT